MCDECERLAKLLEKAGDEIVHEKDMNAARDLIALRATRAEITLKAELEKAREEEPEADDVRELMHLWRDECKAGSKRHKLVVSDPRGQRTKWALKRYGKERCANAILGCALDDWAMGRNAKSGGRAYNDLAKHIFADNESIERFEGLWLARNPAPPLDQADAIAAECFAAESGPARAPVAPRPVGALPTEEALVSYESRLRASPKLLERLFDVRGWTLPTLTALKIGWNGQRVVFPIRDGGGRLVNVQGYLPGGKPKMRGVEGRPRELFPAPESVEGDTIFLCEGEPDAVSAHQLGLPGVAVPGAAKWDSAWTARLASRRVVVVMDCDAPGRQAAQRISGHLVGHAVEVRVVDLAPERDDGFDLTAFLLAGGGRLELNRLAAETSAVHSIGKAAA